MMGELIAEGFTPETLEAMTGYKLPTAIEKQQAQALVAQDAAYKQFEQQQKEQQAHSLRRAPHRWRKRHDEHGWRTKRSNASAIARIAACPDDAPASTARRSIALWAAQETLMKTDLDDVLGLLHNDRLRSFTIDIETDSTIAATTLPKNNQSRISLGYFGSFMSQMLPVFSRHPNSHHWRWKF